MPLGTEVGLGPGDIVLDGDPAPPRQAAQHPPLLGPLFWHGRPSQQLLSSCLTSRKFRVTLISNVKLIRRVKIIRTLAVG